MSIARLTVRDWQGEDFRTDFRMGVWTEAEACFVVERLHQITWTEPRFTAAPGRTGIAPDTDDEWSDWVHEMIGQFLTIEESVGFDRLAVVTFIDS